MRALRTGFLRMIIQIDRSHREEQLKFFQNFTFAPLSPVTTLEMRKIQSKHEKMSQSMRFERSKETKSDIK